MFLNTQNRDTRAINLKLNEQISAVSKAHIQMVDIKTLGDPELDELQARYGEDQSSVRRVSTPGHIASQAQHIEVVSGR